MPATGEAAAPARPNILVIFGDDIGWANLSLYNPGVMGYATPNIDRIGREGAMFTDHYAQPSCTAGRAAFITGQYPIRSGMTTVGLPGDTLGIKAATPTLAEVLKPQGYATGQFGKNHLGDRNESLPTVHGFDEFYGNLYHLNEEEQPEQFDYPKDPEFLAKYRAARRTEVRRNRRRRPDRAAAVRSRRQAALRGHRSAHHQAHGNGGRRVHRRDRRLHQALAVAGQALVRLAQHQPHAPVHAPAAGAQVPCREADERRRPVRQRMVEHDMQVGALLETLRKSGALDNTIIVYTTDNGPEHSARAYGGTTPFRGEKMTTYEGGVRVPAMVSWPGHIPAGQVLNGIQAHMDLFTTLAAAAGVPDVAATMRQDRKQYIDGVNNLDYWTGKSTESARTDFIYYYESQLTAIRYKQWKAHFATKQDYYAPLVEADLPDPLQPARRPVRELGRHRRALGHSAAQDVAQWSDAGDPASAHRLADAVPAGAEGEDARFFQAP